MTSRHEATGISDRGRYCGGLAAPRTGWAPSATRSVVAQGKPFDSAQGKPKASTLDRIAIMTLNFQRLLRLPDLPDEPQRTLELFDIPPMLADTYGVHKIEFQHYHIPSTEPAFLKELRSRIEKHQSRMTQINLEFGNLNMSAPELRNRLMATDLTKMWVDHAVLLGAARVMINQGQPTHENKAYGIPTLKNMADYGRSKGIIVSVETRGGGGGGATATAPGAAAGAAAATPATPPGPPPLTGPARWTLLAEIVEAAGAHSNVDVGGAGAANQEELHACLKRMFPSTANSLHARVNQNWDFATAVRYLERDLGYKGILHDRVEQRARGDEGDLRRHRRDARPVTSAARTTPIPIIAKIGPP